MRAAPSSAARSRCRLAALGLTALLVPAFAVGCKKTVPSCPREVPRCKDHQCTMADARN